MTMKCTKCGSTVADDAAFCSKCGTPVNSAANMNDPDDGDADAVTTGVTRARANARHVASGGGPQKTEAELWSGTFSPLAMIGPAIGCALVSIVAVIGVAALVNDPTAWTVLLIVLVLLWSWLGLSLLYRRLTVRYRLTTYRFFHDTGLLARTGNRIEVIDIDDVTVHQGLVERMFGVGTIHIASSDRTDPNLKLPGIEDVRTVADLIDSTRRAERQRRGLHIESI
jgi:membrane protein YdbS with pleckstrin-like domain